MPKLSSALAAEFDSTTRARGEAIYRANTVNVQSVSETRLETVVDGTQPYAVHLERHNGCLHVDCQCPYYESSGPCKHIWAVILYAEARGYLRANSVPADIELIEETIDSIDDGGLDELDGGYDGAYSLLPPSVRRALPAASSWRHKLSSLAQDKPFPELTRGERWPSGRQILYLVDVTATRSSQTLLVEFAYRERKQNGDWGKLKTQRLARSNIPSLGDPADVQILTLLAGGRDNNDNRYYYGYQDWFNSLAPVQEVPASLAPVLFPLLCQTGRCHLSLDGKTPEEPPLAYDPGAPWQLWLDLRRLDGHWLLERVLRRGEESMALSEPLLLVRGGLLFTRRSVALLDAGGAFSWISLLRKEGALKIAEGEQEALLEALFRVPVVPPLNLPDELRLEEVRVQPRPCLRIRRDTNRAWAQELLIADLSFDYDGVAVPSTDPRGRIYLPGRRLLVREDEHTRSALARLEELGIRPRANFSGVDGAQFEFNHKKLPKIAQTLVSEGWLIEADGKLFRRSGAFHLDVSTGIDWFEVRGRLEFGDSVAPLPELLKAIQRGENMVRLDDGTYGMLPEDWLRQFGMLAGLGNAESDHVRFRRSQAGLLDVLLAGQPQASFDDNFARIRRELAEFDGIEAAAQPGAFCGRLRGYQCEGLGWMQFLQRFGFGGCLADDMGVGKTAQVLALLQTRCDLRAAASGNGAGAPGPSLVVVPRSLVFNWKQEAARFTPDLRVLDHTGTGRSMENFNGYDIVLTTYGTLRRDAPAFKDYQFDYVILDEAQAIKNAQTESAKAARLLKAGNRLALSGTPIENHLGELWSLFEFLNPGMLGASAVFKLGGDAVLAPDTETKQLLARALRPFILRRTKEQVASELPPKVEQTLYCEMEDEQRRLYDELRRHYRDTLMKRIDKEGMAKSKMHVLEALLRLRQAACHPALIDKARASQPSAKLDMLLPQLEEVFQEGHKALVFSQFTSFLSIVRRHLDSRKVTYEYLDGRTRDRQAHVERFQNDAGCKLFLISLKAGGLGLNLTAADYVFLLDPWWNPAVEAQAIDRTHRIGQNRHVFAYRLIARDSVEEKVLALQNTKRDLADAIIGADNSLIQKLAREDIELLLS